MRERTFLPVLPGSVQSGVSQVLGVGSRVQPFSVESVEKAPRIRDAKVVHSVCPYCAVGCSLNVYVKDGRVIDIEGDPNSPINHGTLCPKGSATFQYTVNPSRLTQTLYRAPRSEEHTSELQSHLNIVCRLLLEKKKLPNQVTLDPLIRCCHLISNIHIMLIELPKQPIHLTITELPTVACRHG